MTFRGQRAKGFTLIEMLVVITIMGVIAALLVTAAAGAHKKAQIDRAKAGIQLIASKIDAYKNKRGEILPNLNPAVDNVTTEMEIYTTLKEWGFEVPEEKKVDPWGNPYIIVLQRDYLADFELAGPTMGYNATPFFKMQGIYRPWAVSPKTKAISKTAPTASPTLDACYEKQDNGYQIISAGPDGKVCRYDDPTIPPDQESNYNADNLTNWQE